MCESARPTSNRSTNNTASRMRCKKTRTITFVIIGPCHLGVIYLLLPQLTTACHHIQRMDVLQHIRALLKNLMCPRLSSNIALLHTACYLHHMYLMYCWLAACLWRTRPLHHAVIQSRANWSVHKTIRAQSTGCWQRSRSSRLNLKESRPGRDSYCCLHRRQIDMHRDMPRQTSHSQIILE